MQKFVVLFFILSYATSTHAQDEIKNYVTAHTAIIKSIEPDSTDYSDLEAIGNAIGNSKIVMLGEQDHGDAPTFLAKTRLIKYLHEKKGFNVLAFESDFFGLNYDWALVQEGKMPIDTLIINNIYTVWAGCSACKILFKAYLPEANRTSKPVVVAGFDVQMFTNILYPVLDSVLHHLHIPIVDSPFYQSDIFPALYNWRKNTNDTIANRKVVGYLQEIKTQMLVKLAPSDFWVMVVDNLVQQNLEYNNWKKDYWKAANTRDHQMALNLKWLSGVKYHNEKIIVWAHNYHVSKYAGQYPEDFMNNAKPMGSVLTEDSSFLNNTYVIGFTSYEGTAGRLFSKRYTLGKPPSNSFENWIDRNLEYAFVDFRQFNAATSKNNDLFFMSASIKGNVQHTNHKARWNHIFDGIFYIRKMYPCEKL